MQEYISSKQIVSQASLKALLHALVEGWIVQTDAHERLWSILNAVIHWRYMYFHTVENFQCHYHGNMYSKSATEFRSEWLVIYWCIDLSVWAHQWFHPLDTLYWCICDIFIVEVSLKFCDIHVIFQSLLECRSKHWTPIIVHHHFEA